MAEARNPLTAPEQVADHAGRVRLIAGYPRELSLLYPGLLG